MLTRWNPLWARFDSLDSQYHFFRLITRMLVVGQQSHHPVATTNAVAVELPDALESYNTVPSKDTDCDWPSEDDYSPSSVASDSKE